MHNITGERLKQLRTDAHLTQEGIAQILNITREAYSLYETNKRQMSFESLCKVADFYNVSTDYLLGQSCSKENYYLRTEEINLINAFRRSDPRGKRILLELSKAINLND